MTTKEMYYVWCQLVEMGETTQTFEDWLSCEWNEDDPRKDR